jgi:hypothetical protein
VAGGVLERRSLAYPVLVLASLALTAGFWPGYWNGDTVGQLQQMQSGQYTDWHAPLLIAAWKPLYDLGFGPGWLLGSTIAVVCLGAYGTYRLGMPRVVAAVAAAATIWFPPVAGFLGVIGRDAWFLAGVLATTAALAQAARRPRARRRPWLVLAVAGMLLTLAARQNGAVCLPVLAGATVWLWRRPDDPSAPAPRDRRDRLRGVGLVVGMLVLVVGVQRIAYVAIGVQASHPEQAPMLYDLMQLSVRGDEVLMGPSYFPAQSVDPLRATVQPLTYDGPLAALRASGAITYPVPPNLAGDVRDDWLHAIVEHPIGWLRVRSELYGRNMGITGPTWWVYHPLTVDNPPSARPRFSGPTRAMWEYLDAFTANPNPTGGPLHRVWVYVLATAVAAVALARRRDVAARLVALLALASIVYNAAWFVGAMDLQYRFMFPNVALGVVVVGTWAGLAVRGRRARRASALGAGAGAHEADEEAAEDELQADDHAGGARDGDAHLPAGVEVPEAHLAPAGEGHRPSDEPG